MLEAYAKKRRKSSPRCAIRLARRLHEWPILYAPWRPEETVLHSVVRKQLETFLARTRERERPVRRYVERELRAFLVCGIPVHGFLRVRCAACGPDRLVGIASTRTCRPNRRPGSRSIAAATLGSRSRRNNLAERSCDEETTAACSTARPYDPGLARVLHHTRIAGYHRTESGLASVA